jgi:N-acylneuraminate cytidylyltransferase
MNVAIITARAGSKSIIDKNVYPVKGQPLIAYPLRAALEARRIGAVYVSTDGDKIAEVARQLKCKIIDRPEDLCGDHVNHGDVIKHAVEYVDKQERGLKNIVILLGNTVMVDSGIIDEALAILDERTDLDSVMTVWEAGDDHPLRAMEIHGGFLRPYGGTVREASTERQSYPKAYYYDQGVWAFRKECVQKREGPNPWWWMGKKSFPIVRTWTAGRDIHSYLDIKIAEWWLANYPSIKKL